MICVSWPQAVASTTSACAIWTAPTMTIRKGGFQTRRAATQIGNIGNGPAGRAGRDQLCQQRFGQRSSHRFDQHADAPAAGQSHGKGIAVADPEFQNPRLAVALERLDRFGDHRAFDAAAGHRSLHRTVAVHDQLGPFAARRRSPGLDHCRDGRAPARPVPIQRKLRDIVGGWPVLRVGHVALLSGPDVGTVAAAFGAISQSRKSRNARTPRLRGG